MKITFALVQDGYGYPPGEAEVLHLEPVNEYGEGVYRLESISFFFKSATLDDVVGVYPADFDHRFTSASLLKAAAIVL